VAEVGGYDEDVGWVGEVRGEESAVLGFGGGVCVADHDGDDRDGGGVGLEGGVFAGKVVRLCRYVSGIVGERYSESIL
jgi:hypothetical protein